MVSRAWADGSDCCGWPTLHTRHGNRCSVLLGVAVNVARVLRIGVTLPLFIVLLFSKNLFEMISLQIASRSDNDIITPSRHAV